MTTHVTNATDLCFYIAGGKGKVTLVSARSGRRMPLAFGCPKDGPRKQDFERPIFVRHGHKFGEDVFLGTIFVPKDPQAAADGGWSYRPGRAHGDSPMTGGYRQQHAGVQYLVDALNRKEIPGDMQVWREDRCAKCGKRLTDPASIAAGLGPECRGER